jgi:hypothetical protein
MKVIEYGISFAILASAAFYSASPKQYIDGLRTKEEMEVFQKTTLVDRQKFKTVSQSYNNDLITLALGLAASYSLIRLVMCLDNKPIIQSSVQPSIAQSQQAQPLPVVINNSIKNAVVNQGDRTQPKQRYTPDLVENTNNKDPYAWMDTLHKVNCLLIYGQQGAGKTTYVDMEVKARQALGHQILVFDPHREYGAWEGLEVVGDGMDYEAIDTELANVNSLIKSRYEQRATVEGFNPRPITIICEEFTDWAVKCQSSDEFFLSSLKDCRKVRIHVIYVAHARTMGVLTKKAGMSVMFENGSTKIEVLGKPDADGGTIPTGFADLYNDPRDSKKAVRVAIPNVSKEDFFEDEIPNDKVIPINRRSA